MLRAERERDIRDRSRERDSGGRDRSRERDSGREREDDRHRRDDRRPSSGGDRERTRDRDDRDRDRDRRDRRSRSRSPRKRSRSRTPVRERKRRSGWDMAGDAPPPNAVAPNASTNNVAPSGMHPARMAMIQGGAPSLAATSSVGGMQKPWSSAQATGGAPAAGNAATQNALALMMQMQSHKQEDNNSQNAKRAYVGNLPQPCQDEDLKTFFCNAMREAGLNATPGEAVVSVYVNTEKHFAFLEFRTPEETTNAMKLDGCLFRENRVKVRRPTDYVGNDSTPNESGGGSDISSMVQDGPFKVFLGGLPYEITEDDTLKLLTVYGGLKAFRFVRDQQTNKSKGFCFFEYMDTSVTDMALDAIHGLQIGPKTLTARRSKPSEPTTAVAMNLPTVPLTNLESIGFISSVQQSVTERKRATRILVMHNMVTLDDLQVDNEYNDIFNDIRGELEKFGDLTKLVIPRPTTHGQGVGRVYAEYATTEQAAAARTEVEGREFGDMVVKTEYMQEDAFINGDLDATMQF